MAWPIVNYEEAEKAGAIADGARLEERVIETVRRVKCPCCGLFLLPVVMIPTGDLPAAFVAREWPGLEGLAALWVCDGCWTKTERAGALLPDGRLFDEARLYEMKGAPAAIVEKIDALIARRLEKYAASEGALKAARGERRLVRNLGAPRRS